MFSIIQPRAFYSFRQLKFSWSPLVHLLADLHGKMGGHCASFHVFFYFVRCNSVLCKQVIYWTGFVGVSGFVCSAVCAIVFPLQNLPIGADCVGSLKLTYISKVRRHMHSIQSCPINLSNPVKACFIVAIIVAVCKALCFYFRSAMLPSSGPRQSSVSVRNQKK